MMIGYLKNAGDAIRTIKALKQNPNQRISGHPASQYKTGMRTISGYLKKSGVEQVDRLDLQSVSFLRKNIDTLSDAVTEIEKIEVEIQALREEMLISRVQPIVHRLLENEGEVV